MNAAIRGGVFAFLVVAEFQNVYRLLEFRGQRKETQGPSGLLPPKRARTARARVTAVGMTNLGEITLVLKPL
jgi:hypothetical protein